MATTGYKISASAQDDSKYNHTQYGTFYASRTSLWYLIAQDGVDDTCLWVKDLATPASPGDGGGWSKCVLDGGSTVAYVDTRDTASPTVFWDDSVHILHVHGGGHSNPRYQQMRLETNGKWTRLIGDGGGATEALPAGLAGVSAQIQGMIVPDTRTDVVATTGVPWMVYYNASTTKLEAISRSGVSNWTTTAAVEIEGTAPGSASRSRVVLCRTTLGDAAALVAAYTYTGVDETGPVKIAYRLDSAALGDAWTKETAVASASCDNHIAVRSWLRSGNTTADLHIVWKDTSNVMKHTWRNSAGVWSTPVSVVSASSRPLLVLDSSNTRLYLFYVGDSGGQTGAFIKYSWTPIEDTIAWASPAVLIEDDGIAEDFEDPIGPNHDVTAAMDLIVACDQNTSMSWWNLLAIADANTAPSCNAGTDATITLPASASLDGTVSDDGNPNPPGTVTTTWSKVSGPGTVTFGNANAVDTTASFSTVGTYVLRLTADDSALQATDDVTITVKSSALKRHVNLALLGVG